MNRIFYLYPILTLAYSVYLIYMGDRWYSMSIFTVSFFMALLVMGMQMADKKNKKDKPNKKQKDGFGSSF